MDWDKNEFNHRITEVEDDIDWMNSILVTLEEKVSKLEKSFQKIKEEISDLSDRIERLEEKIENLEY